MGIEARRCNAAHVDPVKLDRVDLVERKAPVIALKRYCSTRSSERIHPEVAGIIGSVFQTSKYLLEKAQ
jgi:hypothetical protein